LLLSLCAIIHQTEKLFSVADIILIHYYSIIINDNTQVMENGASPSPNVLFAVWQMLVRRIQCVQYFRVSTACDPLVLAARVLSVPSLRRKYIS